MTTIGSRQPRNLLHIILDNGTHDSTGGQATVSPGVDFAGIAGGCGYRQATVCDDLSGFDKALGAALQQSGPELIHLRIKPGSLDKLGRPTVAPREVARRFRDFVTADALVTAR
jgi:phosphonopyruvate decarboxylase